MRVLVMDADKASRSLLSGILMESGYDVTDVSDGLKGMQVMRDRGADAVVTDLFLPEQDGLATIAQLRKEFPDVRVVATTGDTQYLSIEAARATACVMGADAFVSKPFDRVRVLNALKIAS